MLVKTWERYFFKETLKIVFLILFCFYGLYALIDYSNHSAAFRLTHGFLFWKELFIHYTCEFIVRIDLILPFALLIATIKTIMHLNTSNELIALMAGGAKLKRLLRPFIIIAFSGVLFIYLNNQFFYPKAARELRYISDKQRELKKKKLHNMRAQTVLLTDGTILIFQNYNVSTGEFFDNYWIKSYNEIYRIKYLNPYSKQPIGRFVDVLTRNENGELIKNRSEEELVFSEMKFNKKKLLDTITPPTELSLTALWSKLSIWNQKSLNADSDQKSEKQAKFESVFFQKLITPWLCLIAVLGPIPYCIRFSRTHPTFFIYAFSLFGLIACILILNAGVILASRQVMDPFWAIVCPFMVFIFPVVYRYYRI